MTLYTLVRHTGYSVAGNPQFKQAVEERHILSEPAERVIRKASGLIYESYSEAYAAAQKYNYPPEVTGLIPRAKGSFIRRHGFAEEIFIPGADPT